MPFCGVLSTLAVALLWFVSKKFHYFTDYSLRSYSDYYWPRRSGLLLHLTGGLFVGQEQSLGSVCSGQNQA